MTYYLLTQNFQGLTKDTKLIPVPGYSDPIPFATEAEIAKDGGAVNHWFASYLNDRPEIFQKVTETKTPNLSAGGVAN